LIIAVLLQEFVQGGAVRACRLQLQLKSNRREEFGKFGEAQLPGATVLKGVQGRAADARPPGENCLAKLEQLPALGNLFA
jgi:hypothetical protein